MNRLNAEELRNVNGGFMEYNEACEKYRGEPLGRKLNSGDVNQNFFIDSINEFYGVFRLTGVDDQWCKFRYALNDGEYDPEKETVLPNPGFGYFTVKK